jgi:hypothetical protein
MEGAHILSCSNPTTYCKLCDNDSELKVLQFLKKGNKSYINSNRNLVEVDSHNYKLINLFFSREGKRIA